MARNPFAGRCPIDEIRLRELLEDVRLGRLGADDAVARLRELPYQDLGFAKVDHHRALRRGFPEVVFGPGKTPQQTAEIAVAILESSDRLLVTKAAPEAFTAVQVRVPDAVYNETARAIVVDRRQDPEPTPGVVVASGGTSDLPAAVEAAVTAELMGCRVERVFDVGVSGLHRLLDHLPTLQGARVIVAVAGMEGALPSVIAGLVRGPVIAVPTSVGYGVGLGGVAALMAMLNSCAPGVAVVNIDNGFGAGYLAAQVVRGEIGD